jgi:heme/copper-type cytochrome/quinol oxidase subunit 2
MKTLFELLKLNSNRRGQMTVVNLIMLVITLIILVGIFPVITSMVSTGISGLTNDGLPSATNAMISALFALIPIVMVLGYIILQLIYQRPNFGNNGGNFGD